MSKKDEKIWLVADRHTVHQDGQQIPPGIAFQGDKSLIDRGVARKANRDEIGDRDAG